MKNYFILFLCSFYLFACNQKKAEQQSAELPEPQKEQAIKKVPENKSDRIQPIFEKSIEMGKVNFQVSAENREMTKIKVSCDDLSMRKYKHEFDVEGQIKDAFSLDLNKDGFNELYMVVQLTDDSGLHEIIGVASYNDKSAGEITVNDVKAIRMSNTDKVFQKDGQLYREFVDEKNIKQVCKYQLSKGEAGYILKAVEG